MTFDTTDITVTITVPYEQRGSTMSLTAELVSSPWEKWYKHHKVRNLDDARDLNKFVATATSEAVPSCAIDHTCNRANDHVRRQLHAVLHTDPTSAA